jgi:hypothetical protein
MRKITGVHPERRVLLIKCCGYGKGMDAGKTDKIHGRYDMLCAAYLQQQIHPDKEIKEEVIKAKSFSPALRIVFAGK